MSSVSINNVTRTVEVVSTGSQGPIGVNWRGDWALATDYSPRDGVYRDGSSYRATVQHTSSAATQPGVGADWQDVWTLLALGSDVESVAAVAAIAAQIVTTASISAEIQTVASYSAQVVTVAADIDSVVAVAPSIASVVAVAGGLGAVEAVAADLANIGLVAADRANIDIAALNIGAILAAPQAAADAQTYAGQALGYKDEAAALELSTEGLKAAVDAVYAQLVALYAGNSDYSNTLAQMTGGAKEVVAAADVVAHFIYDTTLDSDRGEWRKRCRHTSWYNEPLNTSVRGSRRGIPQKMLVVVRVSSVTIYDLDDKNCPMWMLFSPSSSIRHYRTTGTPGGVSALNGCLYVGADAALNIFDFVADRSWHHRSNGRLDWTLPRIADRNNTSMAAFVSNAAGAIVNNSVSAVAATVLPGTPIDPVRKLPTPTVDVSTAAGQSRIHWDGRVTNSGSTRPGSSSIARMDGAMVRPVSSAFLLETLPDYLAALVPMGRGEVFGRAYSGGTGPKPIGVSFNSAVASTGKLRLAAGTNGGLSLVNLTDPFVALPIMAADITTGYSSGYMAGEIKLALAESTADVTSLVGATPLNDDFSSYADTAAMLAVWTPHDSGTALLSSGKIEVTTVGFKGVYRSFSCVVGQRYRVGGTVGGPNSGRIYVHSTYSVSGTVLNTGSLPIGTFSAEFVATAATMYVMLSAGGSEAVVAYDDLRIDRVVSDRSVAGNHPRVVGTVTRAAVAAGAEMAGYSVAAADTGFALPASVFTGVGTTGNFSVAFWLASAGSGSTRTIFYQRNTADTTAQWLIRRTASGTGVQTSGFASLTSTTAFADGRYKLVVIQRRQGVLELWVNGVREAAGADTTDMSGSTKDINILYQPASTQGTDQSIALPRLSQSAYTPAQIRAMYEAEKPLFDPGAKCLLPGNSVSALAYDDTTDLLHVATTAGSARLKGLAVVDRDVNVYTGVDARSGIVATRDAGSADIVLPAIGLREHLLGHNGGPPLYDRKVATASGVTTNATPTVIARFPLDRDEGGEWVIRTYAREYGDPASAELAAYEDVVLVRRVGEGNIEMSGTSTQRVIREVTSSMAVTIAVNTGTQSIEVTATGVASKNIEWTVEARLAA